MTKSLGIRGATVEVPVGFRQVTAMNLRAGDSQWRSQNSHRAHAGEQR